MRMSSPAGASGKVCVACGQDCSARPRTKDAQGRYTCKACADRLAAKRQAGRPAAPLAGAADDGPDDGPDDAAIMAALVKDTPASTLTESCPSCGSGLISGAVVCTICGFNKATGKAVKMERVASAGAGAGGAGAGAAAPLGQEAGAGGLGAGPGGVGGPAPGRGGRGPGGAGGDHPRR